MKKAIIQTTILIFSLGLSLLFFSCNTPANSSKNESTSDDSKQEIPAPKDNGISSRTPPSVNATLAEDFIRGFDASMVSALEENGVKFYTEKGNEIDIFELLKNNGVNWIRLRLWVNPSNYAGNTLADG
ncbi:MAG: glycosyl hydrolase 53 family protein, partial [Spirochaetia bacterium]|nr:glycosyl hydrolase 53 family protein [Spirochaetia bacterium]